MEEGGHHAGVTVNRRWEDGEKDRASEDEDVKGGRQAWTDVENIHWPNFRRVSH